MENKKLDVVDTIRLIGTNASYVSKKDGKTYQCENYSLILPTGNGNYITVAVKPVYKSGYGVLKAFAVLSDVK